MRRMRSIPIDSTTERMLDELASLGDVEARRMFGGTGLYLDEVMFAIVYDGRVYLKVDEESRADFVAAGSAPFQPRPTQTLASYYEIPEDVLDDAEKLRDWAARAARAAGVG